MGYKRAEDILPKEVLELVQQYAQGQMIYIPRKSQCHRHWGAKTKTREELTMRNRQMCAEHESGITVTELSEKYFLTEKSVQRIIRNFKKEGQENCCVKNDHYDESVC